MKEWSHLYLITVSKSFFLPPPQNSNFKLHVKLLIWIIIPSDIKYLQRWLFQYSRIRPRTFNTHENSMSIINSLLQWNSLKTIYSAFPITLLEFNELCTIYRYLKFTILLFICLSHLNKWQSYIEMLSPDSLWLPPSLLYILRANINSTYTILNSNL